MENDTSNSPAPLPQSITAITQIPITLLTQTVHHPEKGDQVPFHQRQALVKAECLQVAA